MRPLAPVPQMWVKSAPNWRASRRMAGLACGRPAPQRCVGGGGLGAGVLGVSPPALGIGLALAGGSVLGAGAVGAAAVVVGVWVSDVGDNWPSRSPCDTVSPSRTLTLSTTPAAGAGMSMAALSDSRVTTGSSALIVAPAAM